MAQEKSNGAVSIGESGPSGRSIRPGVIRAIEKQHKASLEALAALTELAKDVERAFKLGVIRTGE